MHHCAQPLRKCPSCTRELHQPPHPDVHSSRSSVFLLCDFSCLNPLFNGTVYFFLSKTRVLKPSARIKRGDSQLQQKEWILVLDINQKKTQGSHYSVAADIRVEIVLQLLFINDSASGEKCNIAHHALIEHNTKSVYCTS